MLENDMLPTPATIQAVIFDMDGLMIDTERLHHESFTHVLDKYGIKPKLNNQGVAHIQGISAIANWDRFKHLYGLTAQSTDLAQQKNQAHRRLLQANVTAMPGLMELLQQLRQQPIKTAIASSSIREHIDLVVAKLNIGQYFDAIVSGEEVAHGKPAPDIFLKAAADLDVQPKFCVVLEDALAGVKAAKAAGMLAIAVPNEFTRGENFALADLVAPSLREVLPLLPRLRRTI